MKQSAGIVAYRKDASAGLQVLLVHPGGPFYKNKDDGVWSIPKGEYEFGEDAIVVAKREFEEETGNTISIAEAMPLTPVKIKSGKVIMAWAIEAAFEKCFISSNHFEMKWPPRSGKMQSFAEVDRADWFTIAEASLKILSGQLPLIIELQKKMKNLST